MESTAFRAQLVVPEQRQMFDYWQKCAGTNSFPTRSCFKPMAVPRLLPGISLIEVNPENLAKSKIRLAGTRLREAYDREVTGTLVEDLDWDAKRNYWIESLKRVVHEALPTQGILRGPRQHKDHLVQYWLRLPLGTSVTGVNMILGFDYFALAPLQMENGAEMPIFAMA